MTKQDDNKKPTTTEALKKDETQKLNPSSDGSQKFSGSVVAASNAADAIEALKQKVEELENKYKRALADYQNLEKRVVVERQEWIFKANKELLLHLLPVLDTLMLVEKHIKVGDEGINLSIKQFQDLLKGEDVQRIEVLGKQFDPRLMQCIQTVVGEEGKVLEELQIGYKYKDDTILRVALVKVGSAKQNQ